MNVIRKWLGALLCMLVVGTLTAEQCSALYSPDPDDDTLAMQEEDGSTSEESENSSSTWGGKKIEGGGSEGIKAKDQTDWQQPDWGCCSAAGQWFAQPFLIRSCSKIHCKEASVLLADRVPHRPYFLLYQRFQYHSAAC